MYELDAAIYRFCEALGFKLDMGAPSHVAALEDFKKRLKEISAKGKK